MRFRRIIKNQVRGRAVVQKFNKHDFTKPVQEVLYAMPPFPALTYYFQQFIVGDFAWEKYPKYIEGTLKSSSVKDVYYYDELQDFTIRSSPYTVGEKWKFCTSGRVKSVLPERKKHLVLKKVEVKSNDTSKEDNRSNRAVIDFGKFHERKRKTSVGGNKSKVHLLRTGVHGAGETEVQRNGTADHTREQEVKVVAECCRRPKLRKGEVKKNEIIRSKLQRNCGK